MAVLQGPITVVANGEDITYWPHYYSTPCLHDLHDQCKGKCKFCEERCRCPHHQEENVPSE
jgi:hypothetical protein